MCPTGRSGPLLPKKNKKQQQQVQKEERMRGTPHLHEYSYCHD
jgi:hypothetical protein